MRQIKIFTIIFINILFLGLFSVSSAQVIEGDVILSTQDEVDSFSGTSITGYLIIGGSNIVDLTPLLSLTNVGSYLTISNISLINLDGLSNLDSVGGDLSIRYNYSIKNLDGLSNLSFVGGKLAIFDNNAISNLDGLSNLDFVGGKLTIAGNWDLENIAGLSNVDSYGGEVYISTNRLLSNLNGLINNTSIMGGLTLYDNDALVNLDGLSNLDFICGNLNIYGCDALTNLDGLNNLNSVGGNLEIRYNHSLSSFCGLYELLSGELEISYYVYGNLVNPTKQQIIDAGPCTTLISSENELIPKYYKLQQNYPNPFNPETTISYDVKELTSVILKIYNVNGQLISTLLNKRMQLGHYKIQFNGSDLASGIYLYSIEMGNFKAVKKMVLLQ